MARIALELCLLPCVLVGCALSVGPTSPAGDSDPGDDVVVATDAVARDAPAPGRDAVALTDGALRESSVPRDTGAAADAAAPRDVPALEDVAPQDVVIAEDVVSTNDSCRAALQPPLQLPLDVRRARIQGTTMVTSSGNPGRQCGTYRAAQLGAADAYPLHLDARTGVIVGVDPGGGGDALISVRRACDDVQTEVACRNERNTTASVVREVLDPGDYFVVVSLGAVADYDLRVATFELPANDACERAIELPVDGVLRGQRLGPSSSRIPCDQNNTHAVYYAVTVPAGHAVTVLAETTSSVVLSALGSCEQPRCDRSWYGSVTVPNPGASPIRTIVAASAALDGNEVAFDLRTEDQVLPGNSVCVGAVAVGDGTRLSGQVPALPPNGSEPICGVDATAPRLYYRATVPPGHTLSVRATTEGSSNMPTLVRVMASCDAAQCPEVDGSDYVGWVAYTNRSSDPVDVTIAAVQYAGSRPLPFDLAVDILAPAPAGHCEAAIPVSDGTVLREQIPATGLSLDAACGDRGRQALFYRATVPPNHRLLVDDSPNWFAVGGGLHIARDCAELRCPTTMPQNGWLDDGRQYINRDPIAHDVIIALLGPTQPVDLAFSIRPVPPLPPTSSNTTEATALPVGDGTHLTGQRPSDARHEGFNRDVCTSSPSTRPVSALYYSAVIPPHTALHAEVTPEQGPDWAIVQIAHSHGYLLASPEETAIDEANVTDAPRPVTLVVATQVGGQSVFALDVSFRPVDAVVHDVAVDCEDMLDADALPDGVALDEIAPGFVWPFAGGIVNRVARPDDAHRSGLEVSTDAGASWGEVFPYAPIRGSSSPVSVRVFGTAPSRHITFGWRVRQGCDFSGFYSATLQARVDEGTGALEYHYCHRETFENDGGVNLNSGMTPVAGVFGLRDPAGARSFQTLVPGLPVGTAVRIEYP